MWFQQDGVICQLARNIMKLLRAEFGKVHLFNLVYSHKLAVISADIDNIVVAIGGTPASQNWISIRCEQCLRKVLFIIIFAYQKKLIVVCRYIATKTIGQFTQAVVSLYWVYCWTIIQQCMLVVDNFHVKNWYTFFYMILKDVLCSCYQIERKKKMCICLFMFFKSCLGFVLSNCLNAKENTFEIQNTQYSIPFTNNQVYSI